MQKKNLNIRKSSGLYSKRKQRGNTDYNNIFSSKWICRHKPYSINVLNKINNPKIFTHRLNIFIKFNNIFCTFTRIYKNIVLLSRSSGNYNVRTSKKNLKHTFKIVLSNFFREMKKIAFFKGLIITIVAPIRLRKKTLRHFGKYFHRKNLLIDFKKMKCYNGCRPPKKVRRKRKRIRFLK